MRPSESPKGERLERAEKQAPVKEELAREAWELLFELLHGVGKHFPALVAEFDLSPVQAQVLRMLGEGPQPMSGVAGFLGCDASNVTGLVDRLEARGLVERQNAPHDRRVKLLALTVEGRELGAKVKARFRLPPPPIAALSATDLRALRDVMSRALENMHKQSEAPAPQAQSSKKV